VTIEITPFSCVQTAEREREREGERERVYSPNNRDIADMADRDIESLRRIRRQDCVGFPGLGGKAIN